MSLNGLWGNTIKMYKIKIILIYTRINESYGNIIRK